MRSIAGGLLGVLFAGSIVGNAQQPIPPTFRAGTTLVDFTVVAVDARGNPVVDLRKDEISIVEDDSNRDVAFFQFEGVSGSADTGAPAPLPSGTFTNRTEYAPAGARRPITQFSVERVPISLGILLDFSGSMARDPQARAEDSARWADTRSALELLVTRLDPKDEVLFAVFADKVALAVSWTREHSRIVRSFDSLQPRGRTSLFDAVKMIAQAFQVAQHQRKVLLLISDGLDNAIEAGLPMPANTDAAETQRIQHGMRRAAAAAESKAAVRDSGALLYAIGMGTRKGAPVDVAILERLTVDSGGYVEPLRDPSDISAAVARICDELQSQYLLGFEPAHADGNFHAIAVKLKNNRLKARARAGYVAK